MMSGKLSWVSGLLIGLVCVAWTGTSAAYITVHPQTLGSVVALSTTITLVRVEKVSQDKGIIIFRKVRDIKGKLPKDVVKHVFGTYDPPENEAGLFKLNVKEWSYVLQWAEPGKEAVIMGVHQPAWGHYNHVYVDQCWYGNYCPRGQDLTVWHAIYSRSEMLRNWYCGSVAGLVTAIEEILDQKEVVVPVAVEGDPDDLRLGRAKIRGLKASQRIGRTDFKGNGTDWSDSKETVEALARDLTGRDEKLRLRAARSLEHWFGPALKNAMNALVEATADEHENVRKVAVAALANRSLDAGAAIPALSGVLKSKDRNVRLRAAEALARWGPTAKTTVGNLTLALKDEDRRVAEAAAAALVCIDADVEGRNPTIKELLEKRASVGGKYSNLLRRIKTPQDLGSLPFQNRAAIVGITAPVADYHGHKGLPKGHWVYVYPYWYIWGERAEP
jgi:hypothetical protein